MLPGTGGLTRVTDKRHVRHDLADIFCTTSEGVRGQRAKDWRLVDEIAKPAAFDDTVREHALALAAAGVSSTASTGVKLIPIERRVEADSLHYSTLRVEMDRAARTATFVVQAPAGEQPTEPEAIEAAGADWYALRLARDLDDAILSMRTNELDLGTWILRTEGDAAAVLALDATLLAHREHWFVRQTIGFLRRSLQRLDVSSRSLFALIDEGSCFAGTLLELALACDRSYHLALPDDPDTAPTLVVGEANFGLFPMVTGENRLERRFYHDRTELDAVRAAIGQPLDADAALELGLVTSNPDDLDWEDEVRLALEERVGR